MPEQTQIPVSAIVPAPSDWTVPGNVELILKAVTATFTDNGAAGDWLPAVTLLSDSGHVIARAVDQGVKVTAGSNADVSWFPGVKKAATATTFSGLPWFGFEQFGTNVLGGGVLQTIGLNTGTFDFSDSTIFAVNASHNARILKGGQYMIVCFTSATVGVAPPAGSFARIQFSWPGLVVSYNATPLFQANESGGFTARAGFIQFSSIHKNAVPVTATLQLAQNSGGTVSMASGFYIVQISSLTSFL